MKCNRCGREIDELEKFCDDCKKELKEKNSKSDVKELEKLIENQKKLNELENTKELVNLNVLVEEKLEKIDEETKSFELYDETNKNVEEKKFKNTKKNKKKLFIVISIILFVLIISLVVLIVILSQNKKMEEQPEEVIIDYEKVVNLYGSSITNVVEEYINLNDNVPTWQYIIENLTFDEYEVECNIHNIYSNGNIYLSECSVNNKKVEYTYGEEQEEIKEGKKINIYEEKYNTFSVYYGEQHDSSTLIGTITCKTENCEYISAYERYVLINEENEYYLYDYTNDSINFGPFMLEDELDVLVNNNILYAILYKANNNKNIYNVNTGKVLKNIEGQLLTEELYFDPTTMYKYNYAVFNNNGENEFVNLKTGNVSYTIKGTLSSFIEDASKKIVYITVYADDYSKFRIYNSNGKILFGGKEYSNFQVGTNCLIVGTNNSFEVYDNNLKLKTTSKDYDKILGLYQDFVVATIDNDLFILSIDDIILATFENGWDEENYTFHSMLSGWYTENDKNGIYLVIENNLLSYGTLGSGMEYYYIPSTKETGIIETIGIDGYAKPVLYLYPEEKTNINVTFENTSLLTTTYPKFKNMWSVTAYPNGDLYDEKGNYYYALYWEEDRNHYIDFSEGFYVTSDNAIEFLEEKLSIIGLNDKERNEFIMYWLPILEKNKKSLVYFELTEERDYYNKLIINPQPDSMLRIAIHVKKVNKKTSVKEQKLTSFERIGYTAVEWGGVIY